MKAFFYYCAVLALSSSVCLSAKNDQVQKYTETTPHEVIAIKPTPEDVPVKNVIFMIGDGMGMEHLFAGLTANKGKLNIENCPVVGISKTSCANKLVTDSAASGTAMAVGEKVNYGSVGINPEGKELPSLTVKAAELGKSTGIAVTCELNDATPASFSSHNKERSKAYELIGKLPESRVDFFFGGGSKYFENRPDKRDIFEEMEKKGFKISRSWDELSTQVEGKALAVVAQENLPVPEDRVGVLSKASMKAISLLSKNKNGFFLMIEGSKIDKEAHANNLPVMIQEVLDFDKTAGEVLAWASKHPGTLVVITADHNTGSFNIIGGETEKGEVVGKFSSTNHNGLSVPVYAYGAGSRSFSGIYENTELFHKINALMNAGAKERTK